MEYEEKTQERIINDLRQNVAELEKSETQHEGDVIENLSEDHNESDTHKLKIKAGEIKAYLEFFSYEAK